MIPPSTQRPGSFACVSHSDHVHHCLFAQRRIIRIAGDQFFGGVV